MTYFHQLGLLAEFPKQNGTRSPQQLLLNMLVDYTAGPHSYVPSSGLVELLSDFGVSEAASRATISRLARRGLLQAHRDGRRTFYALPADVHEGVLAQETSVRRFGEAERPWDGTWTVIVFRLDDDTQGRAHAIRGQLRWLGFAPIRDGVWISPHADLAYVSEHLRELVGENAIMLNGPRVAGDLDVIAAWDLTEILGEYRAFVTRCRESRYKVRAGSLSDKEAFVLRSDIQAAWRRFLGLDPDLPREFLPDNWGRAEARRAYGDLDQDLVDMATRHVHRVVLKHGAPIPSSAPAGSAHQPQSTADVH